MTYFNDITTPSQTVFINIFKNIITLKKRNNYSHKYITFCLKIPISFMYNYIKYILIEILQLYYGQPCG